jgi:hypothetical protein
MLQLDFDMTKLPFLAVNHQSLDSNNWLHPSIHNNFYLAPVPADLISSPVVEGNSSEDERFLAHVG